MITTTARRVLFALAGTALACFISLHGSSHSSTGGEQASELVNICLITTDVQRLVGFYEPILGIKPVWSGQDYAEFRTGVGVLAVFSSAAQEKYIPGAAEPGKNRSAILEFRVPDVDREYARLQGLVKTWVKPPTTQPWGTRSIYFRDPDGNLVDFYVPPRQQRN